MKASRWLWRWPSIVDLFPRQLCYYLSADIYAGLSYYRTPRLAGATKPSRMPQCVERCLSAATRNNAWSGWYIEMCRSRPLIFSDILRFGSMALRLDKYLITMSRDAGLMFFGRFIDYLLSHDSFKHRAQNLAPACCHAILAAALYTDISLHHTACT